MTAPVRAARGGARMSPGWPELVGVILRGAPALPNALCRGRGHLFDPVAQHEPPDAAAERHAQALELCARCPALADCRTWLDSLPPRARPGGVVAGQIVKPPKIGRPRKDTTA